VQTGTLAPLSRTFFEPASMATICKPFQNFRSQIWSPITYFSKNLPEVFCRISHIIANFFAKIFQLAGFFDFFHELRITWIAGRSQNDTLSLALRVAPGVDLLWGGHFRWIILLIAPLIVILRALIGVSLPLIVAILLIRLDRVH